MASDGKFIKMNKNVSINERISIKPKHKGINVCIGINIYKYS